MTKQKRAKKRATNMASAGKRGKIAFQGEPGANSHIACKQAYPAYAPLACATFEDAFAAVHNGRAALAMIPIDNSVAGRVADIHHLTRIGMTRIKNGRSSSSLATT
jgi:prephenate dehydratase